MTTARLGRQPSPPQLFETELIGKHLRLGWWAIALFGAFGLVLETLHAFKIGAYLDAANETRRLMWTLAHAHGTLLGVLHMGLAATVRAGIVQPERVRQASTALTAATVVLPGGFLLGGIRFYAGDPGVGIGLVPVGAVLLIYAAVAAARSVASPVKPGA